MEIFMNNKICILKGSLSLSIYFILFLSLFSSILLPGQTNLDKIKVMTFNIRYGTADDGENSWQYRKENVFNELKLQKPDLIGMQEALSFQIQEILNALPEYSVAGVGRDDGIQAGEYSCIFFNKEKFQLDTTETFWFSETPNVAGSIHWGNTITRICTWIKFTDRTSGKSFYHYNLHLDHLSQPSRERSTELLVNKIRHENNLNCVILTGDFNCGDENPAIQTIIKNGLIDTYRFLHQKDKNEGTFNEFKGITSGQKIDFIFVSKDFKIFDSEIIHRNISGKYLSDHFPVSAIISIK